ncbi:MAG: glycosyltransferase [Nibricoccus sp.]
MKIVILGLSITSSWGNGHATTYRGLVRELCARGHDVVFLERDTPWYSAHRDAPRFPPARVAIYESLRDLRRDYAEEVRTADAVIVGSYVPEGIQVGRWVLATARGVTAFYDIDTPVTLAALERGKCEYLSAELVGKYQLYLSFTGGPMLRHIERRYFSPMARPLYCSVDPEAYAPEKTEKIWDLGYLGTYSVDRQPGLTRALVEVARRWPEGKFIVAGPMYPKEIRWPRNVARIDHLPPAEHRRFYNQQRFTLNVTRADMIAAGYSPSVRLFEAAACGIPVISDYWKGIEEFFVPGKEILIADTTERVLDLLSSVPAKEAAAIGAAARKRVLKEHTPANRAASLERVLRQCRAALVARATAERLSA